MKFHPYAEIFPLIEGAEFDALVADIRSYGQREKIVLYRGQILDGRNRWLACKKAGVEPEVREFKGTDSGALALVVSANVQRRHMTEAQRAMAAARIATLTAGGNPNAPRGAMTQTQAAEQMDVGRRSVQRARQVIEQGSKELQRAVEHGDVPLKRAAAVTELPKREQLAAAQRKPESQDVPERIEPDVDEEAVIAAAEQALAESLDKVLAADDKLAAAHVEIKRQAAEIASLRISRDGYMNQCGELVRRLKAAQRQIARLEKQVA